MIAVLSALILATVLAPFLIYYLGRPAFGILAIAPGAGFFWVLSQLTNSTFNDGNSLQYNLKWMPDANLNITLRMDGLSALFSLIILGMGALVLLYCWGYFDQTRRRLAMFGAQITAFATAMFGLVVSDNILMMYVFWEITSLLSFILVSYYG